MIAVFCENERDFSELEPTPVKMFKRIRTINDVAGITFNGIIETRNWWKRRERIKEAYEYLKARQPELFK